MTEIKPQFVIVTSGFKSGSLAHKNYYEETLFLPSLHIMGLNDQVINNTLSEDLAAIFEDPCNVRHVGGHYFPATAREKSVYIDFLRNRLVEHLEKKELERAEVISTNPLLAKPNGTAAEEFTDDSD